MAGFDRLQDAEQALLPCHVISFALAPTCFVLLTIWKAPPWLVVPFGALGAWRSGFSNSDCGTAAFGFLVNPVERRAWVGRGRCIRVN
ncbi:hypothetical protein D3218_15345 [Aureimonas flava]|uniref:Uncharacterized protein n=1 Tax=Aureimonas flava TaxID=2320271 RepID=A0A3A1WG48_9HYPH|nr:hypothetical protein D3218_15345 [Aureimonas flava]